MFELPVRATLPGRAEQAPWASGARLSFRPRRAAPTRKLAAKGRGCATHRRNTSQKGLVVEATLKVLLAPYRQEEVDEVFEILNGTGGIDKLHLAYYQENDLNDDKEWDIWRVEGPSFVWHFRGAPHVHAYINIGVKSIT